MSTSALVARRRRLTLGACAGALALGLAACGGGGDADPDPAQAVPASVPVYAQVTLRTDGDLKANLESVSKRLLGTSDIAGEIDKQLKANGDGETIARDFAPWVGSRAGIFLSGVSGTSPDYAAVLSIANDDKAQQTLDRRSKGKPKKSYKNVDYYETDAGSFTGKVDDYLVSGSERGLHTVIDTVKGDNVATIGDADRYTTTLKAVGDTEDAVATVYVAPQELVDAVARSGGIPTSALTGVRQSLAQAGSNWGGKLGVTDSAVSLDLAATGVKGSSGQSTSTSASTKALTALPGDAWLGIGIGELGAQLRNALQQGLQTASVAGQDVQAQLDAIQRQLGIDLDDDLLSWMGDAGLFARGSSIATIGGALVVQTSDPAKTRQAIAKVSRLLARMAPNVTVRAASGVRGADDGVRITDPSIPFPIFAVEGGGRFVLAIGQQAAETALSPSSTLAESTSYKQAAAALDGIAPSFFLDFAPINQLLRGLGLQSDPSSAQALRALSRLGTLSSGTKRSGTTLHTRLVLTLPQ
jgi:Protein of unknown function (DUF3352)